jgi:ribonuclease HII
MTSLRVLPLAALRTRAQDAAGDADATAWSGLVRALRRDPRAGARALARALERRRELVRREEARVAALYARCDALRAAGMRLVAGVDEVGMGPLAGPVVAAAVVLSPAPRLPGLDDSKRKDARERSLLDAAIRASAVAISIAAVEPDEIDRVNIYQAGLLAMRRAVHGLEIAPDHVLVDGRSIPGLAAAQTALANGDALEAPIAAASIVAKVHRDALMVALAERYPGYGFERHKGYTTADHVAALERLGPCPIHRRSFARVAERAG